MCVINHHYRFLIYARFFLLCKLAFYLIFIPSALNLCFVPLSVNLKMTGKEFDLHDIGSDMGYKEDVAHGRATLKETSMEMVLVLEALVPLEVISPGKPVMKLTWKTLRLLMP